jgi:hypothetical protein
MDNKQKLICKYFSYPNRKSTDIRRQHNKDLYFISLLVLAKLIIDTMNAISILIKR